jgi:hypothetical protein
MDQKGITEVTRYLQDHLGGCMIVVRSAQGHEDQQIEVICDENRRLLQIRKGLLENLSPEALAEAVRGMGLAEHMKTNKCMIVQDENTAVEC